MNKLKIPTVLVALLFLVPIPVQAMSVAMIVWRGETDAERGFLEGLRTLGHDAKVTVFNAEQDKRNLGQIIRVDLAGKLDQFDYIYTFGTTATKAVKTHLAGRKPHIFNIVSFPAEAGILPSENGGRDNTAGVSSRVPTEEQIKSALNQISLQRVAVAFNPREANSTGQLEKLVALGKKYGFEVLPVRVRPDDNLYLSDLRKIEQLGELSAVYLPSDSFLISKAAEIIDLINSNNLPSICAVSAYMKQGCMMGTVADYFKLGELAASIVDEHINGTPLAEIPVKFDTEPRPVVNESAQISLAQ
jgi:ABC-type uncharacterized transport system substrate-binding protein